MKSLDPFTIPLTGRHLIEASAGTGKTYNIASIFVRTLIERDIDVQQILVLTFTKAATKELRDRLMNRLREAKQALQGKPFGEDDFLQKLPAHVKDAGSAIEKLSRAIRSFDEAAIYTIHGFCYQVLQEQAFASGALFDTKEANTDKELTAELVEDYWRQKVREFSQDPLKRPLLKLLTGKGYSPDSLTAEISPYTGKPYLSVRPELRESSSEEDLRELNSLYKSMREEWALKRETIAKIFEEGDLKRYKADWILLMDDWLQDDVASVELCNHFEKFCQSVINEKLKKPAVDKGQTPPQQPFFKLADAYVNLAESFAGYETVFKVELFEHLKQKLPERKEELQILSYSDQLTQLYQALQDRKSGDRLSDKLRKRYPIALVDEFQDTDPVQYGIFRSIYTQREEAQTGLFMIGDPKQSIYGFRGADIFTYLEAKKEVADEQSWSLDKNFRSSQGLIEGVNTLFSRQTDPFMLKGIPFVCVEAGKEQDSYKIDGAPQTPIEIRSVVQPGDELPLNKGTAQERAAVDTANQISRLLEKASDKRATIGDKPLEAGDIAVLVRSHYQEEKMRKMLSERGIKSVQYSQQSVFESEQALELYFVLRAVADPVREDFVRAALCTSLFGYSAGKLSALESNESTWADWLNRFLEWNQAWKDHGFTYMFRLLMRDGSVAQTLVAGSNGERKLTNVQHISDLLRQREQTGRGGIRSLLQWLLKKHQNPDKEQEEEQLLLESDENLVKIVTIHSSKGLEYPVVFCPFLWHAPQNNDKGKPLIYHDPDDFSTTYVDFGGKTDPGRDEKRFRVAEEDLAESVRLAYVAITRAKYKCIISWACAKKTEFSPLGYLLLGEKQAKEALEGVIYSSSKYQSAEPALFESSLSSLVQKVPAVISLQNDFVPSRLVYQPTDDNPERYRSSIFKRNLPLAAGPATGSFSSLLTGTHDQFEIDYAAYFGEMEKVDARTNKNLRASIFSFPKGPKPGTCVHEIFEEADFENPAENGELISQKLKKFGIASSWEPVINKMLETVLKKSLDSKNNRALTLQALSRGDRTAEIEFYFTTGPLQLREILQLIRGKEHVPESAEGYLDEGYMKGFIDLTFCYNGRYYILDYKTNYLGDTYADYGPEQLKGEMQEAIYDLQYHLYTVALHRYLQSKLRDYSYKKHFGGAFYLFVRGINKQGREGIYFDRPAFDSIKRLDAYLSRREGDG